MEIDLLKNLLSINSSSENNTIRNNQNILDEHHGRRIELDL